MIQRKTLDRVMSQCCASVCKSIRIFFMAITAIVCNLSVSAADFGTPEINCQSRRDNVFIATNWDEDADYLLAEKPFTVTFYRLSSISKTDLTPYLIDVTSGNRYYFKDVVCHGNQLTLSQPDFGSETPQNSFEHYKLVVPAGAVSAQDGTTNETEYQRGFMKLSLTFIPHIIDGKIIDYFTIAGEGADEYAMVHITLYSPSMEQIEYFGGHAMCYDFQAQGTYDMFASVNVSFRSDDGMSYVGSANTYSSIELVGTFSGLELTTLTNDDSHVTKLIATFPNNETMSVNRTRTAGYPYIENEAGERTYFDYHNFMGNELHLPLNSPISENGNYRLVIPEQYVNYLWENGLIVIPNKQEICHDFTISTQQADSGIDTPVVATAESLYDVYNLQGVKVASQVSTDRLPDNLRRGIYILTNGNESLKMQIPLTR